MKMTLKQSASILGKSDDEVMYLVQSNILQAGVDQETLAWEFELDQVLQLKKTLEEQDKNGGIQQLLVE
jgi:hypothetical protein